MKILVTIPALNEEKSISHVIESLPKEISGVESIDVLVIDDGSGDKTRELAKNAGAQLISFDLNRGLSFVFRRAVEEALKRRVDIMINIDADGQFNGQDIIKLIKPIISNRADCVTASRFIDKTLTPKMPSLKKWGNHQVAKMVSFVSGQKFYDVSCGFRAYSREALLHMNLFSKFTYTHETILNLAFKGIQIIEVPILVRGEREFGESKIAKNLWRYGYNMLNTIFRTALDYRPLKFFGWTGVSIFTLGLFFDLFLFGRLIFTGEVTPYKTLGIIGLSLNTFGLSLLIIGLIADMINRVRLTQERMLYYQKKNNKDG